MSTTKAAAFKPAINIPFRLTPKFVDVRPGKPWEDPNTGKTKQLPAQVSIKGIFDGVETICFLPGAVWKNIKCLAAAGIINEQDTDALEMVDKVTNIPLLAHEEFIATLAKPAGAKYADMEFVPATTRPAQQPPSKRLPPPEQRTTKAAHRAGPDIPGMDEAMEEDGPYEDGPPAHWNEVPPPDDAEPALTPREVREREAQAKGEPSEADVKRALCVSRYLEVYASVYGGLVAIHHAAGSSTTVPHGRATDLVPLSSETIHAAASTIYIEQGKQGLNR